MKFPSWLAAILLPALYLFRPQPGQANLRVPVNLHRPGVALFSPATSLVVEKASLTVYCETLCHVQVGYLVRSRDQVTSTLTFILAADTPVRARINNREIPVSLTRLAEPDSIMAAVPEKPDPSAPMGMHINDVLYSASFPARFHPGINTILIGYRQEPGHDEREFIGYFSGWRSLKEMRYELWPLHEWQLARNFRLHLNATFVLGEHQEVRGRSCARNGRTTGPLSRTEPKTGRVLYKQTWQRNFPDRLEWKFGDIKLMHTLSEE